MCPRVHTRADPENMESMVHALPRKAFGLSMYLESGGSNPESASFRTAFPRKLGLRGELDDAFGVPADR